MKLYITNEKKTLETPAGANLLEVLRAAGFGPDAPCGGNGTCGKCKVLVNGSEQLACKTVIEEDMAVTLPESGKAEILAKGITAQVQAEGKDRYALAFDLGTTTVVAYLMDGATGEVLSRCSCMNPQTRYGGDVISRIQYAMDGGADELAETIRKALAELTEQAAKLAGICAKEITMVSLVGNTAMHHLLLGIDPKPLTVPPYMPSVSHALEQKAAEFLPVAETAVLRVLPNIAGFVGADTVGCLAATRFDEREELTLLIDIGTNGEMVLGNKDGFLACSTAAGPAFEGARISCGMRGAEGAVDHVRLEGGALSYTVIGGGEAQGLCGSGLLDLVAVLLQMEEISESGRMDADFVLPGSTAALTRKDVREVQLAKAAIRAGIELMCQKRGVETENIRKVYLAGAFGSFMDPASACAIGMIPPCLLDRIESIGNAAGEGAKLCALSSEAFEYSKRLAEKAEFLELASMEDFNDCYVDCLLFEEEDD